MIRRTITSRPDWQALVEAEGLVWHSADVRPYWDESACYVFTADQVAEIETASAELYRLFLAAGQADISHRFATPSPDKYAGLTVQQGVGGSPLLDGVCARFECSTEQTVEGGDHILFIGRVHKISYGDGAPLIFSGGKYCTAVPMPTGSAAEDFEKIWGGLG